MHKDKQTLNTVTSFSVEGYRTYGKTALKSMLKYWPGVIRVYLDGPKANYPDLPRSPRLEYKNLFKVPGAKKTLEALDAFTITKGIIGNSYNYRYNAFRFVRKCFAQCDAATGMQDVLIWLDADTEITAPVEEDWLRGLLDEGIKHYFMGYMGRPEWHLCASFLIWDCTHQQSDDFWKTYYDLLVTGNFLGCPEWHDSYWVELLIKQMGLSANNLTEDTAGKGPDNVFNKLFKGKARHLKGNLKKGPKRYQQLIELVTDLQPDNVVEIGTWNGGRAVEMAQAAPGMKYVGFDLFEQATAETDEHEKNVKPHFKAQDVTNMLNANGIAAILVAGNTNESLPGFIEEYPDYKADLIYIDGGHAVETIQNDLEHSLKMLKPGGLIVMDDYYTGLSNEDLDKWGCNRVLEKSNLTYDVLPIADPIKGGGETKLVVVRPEC